MFSKNSLTLKKTEARQGILSVIPVILIILMIRIYPIIVVGIKSFTNWDGLLRSDWIGLSNYIEILTSGELWTMIRNTLILLLHIPIQFFIGLVFALLLYEQAPGWRLFRSISFMPQIISAVIIGYLFRILFSYRGPINILLNSIGLDFLAVEWLGQWPTALMVMIIAIIWQGTGWQTLIILGGLSSISPSIIEAARIDGANYWQRMFRIILPLLIRTVEYTLVISIIWVFTSLFPFIMALTRGGPGYQTTTMDYMIYSKAFLSGNRLGSACAIAIVLLTVTLLLTKMQFSLADKADDWSG